MTGSAIDKCVSTVVLRNEGRQVLLILRGDIYLWSLPGGGVEPGEDWEEAAIREVREETGYEVALDRLVGDYLRPQIRDLKRLFVGHVTRGQAWTATAGERETCLVPGRPAAPQPAAVDERVRARRARGGQGAREQDTVPVPLAGANDAGYLCAVRLS